MRAQIAWFCFLLGMLLIFFGIATLSITGVALLGVVLLAVWAWGLNVFRREFWVQDIDETHPNATSHLDKRSGVGGDPR